jgi:hypothetical protein
MDEPTAVIDQGIATITVQGTVMRWDPYFNYEYEWVLIQDTDTPGIPVWTYDGDPTNPDDWLPIAPCRETMDFTITCPGVVLRKGTNTYQAKVTVKQSEGFNWKVYPSPELTIEY